jgi:hypothetical protein
VYSSGVPAPDSLPRDEWLDDLPPLDTGDQEDDEALGPELPLGALLDEEAALDDDGTPVDVGEDTELLADPDDASTAADAAEETAVEYDIAVIPLEGVPALDRDANDEGIAVDVFDGAIDAIPELEGSQDDGAHEPLDFAISEELPAIDADDEGWFEESPDLSALQILRDDPPPPWSALRWDERRPAELFGEASCLALVPGGLVLAGTELCYVPSSGQPRRALETAGGRVVSVCGTTDGSVLFATTAGTLGRTAVAGAAVGLAGWREVAGLTSVEQRALELTAVPGQERVFARASNGALLMSEDAGRHFERVELCSAVHACTANGAGFVALLGPAGEPKLAFSTGADTVTLLDLEGPARNVALSEEPRIAAHGRVIAVGSYGHGLAVGLLDQGSVAVIAGTHEVTAIAAGERNGHTVVWAALFREARDETELVEIDPHTSVVERIASLCKPAEDSDAGEGHSRVTALVWDPEACRLWVAGAFGLTSFAPPRS